MLKVLYYDCFSGISGDMNLAAMIDLGMDEKYLKASLNNLGLENYEIEVTRESRHSISGTRVDVRDLSQTHSGETHRHAHHHHNHDHDHTDEAHHSHNEHAHSHDHSKGAEHDHEHHVHRNLDHINAMLDDSSLKEEVRDISKKMFRLIAEAEAKVHGTTVDKIHFHEVGAVDSIVDIVGAAICLDYFHVDKIMSSSVQLGGGFVTCAHGTMPVPAPATAEILKHIPVKTGAVQKETTTPTGAAILAANAAVFTDENHMKIEKIGYGIGHQKLEIPNILRVYLGWEDEEQENNYTTQTVYEISCNLDDMNPEHYEYVMEQLFAAGADEVYFSSVAMKKSRPGTKLSILCKPEFEKVINRILFNHTSTLGLRRTTLQKSELERHFKQINTRYGTVTIKMGILNGKPIKYKPEYEDCRKIAEKHNLPVQEVFHSIMNDVRRNL